MFLEYLKVSAVGLDSKPTQEGMRGGEKEGRNLTLYLYIIAVSDNSICLFKLTT